MQRYRAPREGTPPGQVAAIPNKASRPLLLATLVYFVVVLVRPQDLWPPLGAIRPGLIAFVLVGLTWTMTADKSRIFADSIVRWRLFLFAVLLIGSAEVVNHRSWMYVVLDNLEYTVVYFLALPVVLRDPAPARAVLRLFAMSFGFLAVWVIMHGGVGTAAWMTDENDAAAVLILGVCLGYALFAESPQRRTRLIGLALAATCVAGVLSTDSRGGFLGLAAAGLGMAIFSRKLWRYSVTAIVVLLITIPFVPSNYLREMKTINDPTDRTRTERLYSWARAWDMFLDNPVVGVGAGNFPWRVYEYEQSPEAVAARNGRRVLAGRAAHSLPFTLLAETGVSGAVAFFAILGLSFNRVWSVSRSPRTQDDNHTARILATWIGPSLIGFLTAAIFISVLWYPPIWLLFGATVGLSKIELRRTGIGATIDRDHTTQNRRPRRPT